MVKVVVPNEIREGPAKTPGEKLTDKVKYILSKASESLCKAIIEFEADINSKMDEKYGNANAREWMVRNSIEMQNIFPGMK